MTLIVGMKSDNAIVMAADSRGTIGDPRGLTAINDNQIKLYSLGACGLGIAGASEMGAVLLDELLKGACRSVTNIDDAMQNVVQQCADCFTRWFRDIPPAQRPAVIFTLAGYRTHNQTAEPMIYLLNSQFNFAPQLMGNMPCLSGIPQYAVYLVHRYYEPTISVNKAMALAEYLIAETASQDPKVGGRIRMSLIRPDTGYSELTETEVIAIHQANEGLNQRLRQFFLREEVHDDHL